MDKGKELSKWLEIKYIDWMKKMGEVASQREFAEYLDLKPVSLSNYLNGKQMPVGGTVEKLADKLGPEIYDVLGLVRPDKQLQELTSVWHKLDQEIKDQILRMAKKGQEYSLDKQ
jgi:transcriptional regulator with XRE-family HTH domain